VLVTLVKTKQNCLKKLLKTVRTTRRISELVRQRIPNRPTGDRKRSTAICVETTARYNELVAVCRTQTKPRSDVGGRGEMVGEVPRCLIMKTSVDHDTHLVTNPLWRIQLERDLVGYC